MSQSLVVNYVHLVFSTKMRYRWIEESVSGDLYGYISGVLMKLNCHKIVVGGIEDHVHILFALSKYISLVKVVQEVKKSSSKWMKEKVDLFQWQAGYASFSVSYSNYNQVRNYIKNQREHHSNFSYKSELRWLLKKHKLKFDERYLWD